MPDAPALRRSRAPILIRAALLAWGALWLAACASQPASEDDEALKGPLPLTDFVPEIELELLWQKPIGDGQGRNSHRRLALALDAERLLAVAADGQLCAFRRGDGLLLWCRRPADSVGGGVTVGGGLALIGTEDGELLALDAEHGELRWRAQLSGEILSPAVMDGEIVVVQTADGKVHGLAPADGQTLWAYRNELPDLMLRGTASPALGENRVVCGFANGLLVALRRSDGLPLWERRVATATGRSALDRLIDIDGTPLLSGSLVYVASYQGNVAAVDLATGRALWRVPASSGLSLSQGFGNVYVVDEQSHLQAFGSDGGEINWEQRALRGRGLGSPADLLGYIVVADAYGWVHLLSQVDGRVAGRAFAGGIQLNPAGGPRRRPRGQAYIHGFSAPPLVDEDHLYMLSDSGRISAYKAQLVDLSDPSSDAGADSANAVDAAVSDDGEAEPDGEAELDGAEDIGDLDRIPLF